MVLLKEINMKKILIISLLSLSAYLWAALDIVEFNKTFDFFSNITIDNPDYMLIDHNISSDEEAIKYAASGSLILLYVVSGWAYPDSPRSQDLAEKYKYKDVGVGVRDPKIIVVQLLSVSMKEVWETFSNDKFKKKSWKNQLKELKKYIKKNGKWHVRSN